MFTDKIIRRFLRPSLLAFFLVGCASVNTPPLPPTALVENLAIDNWSIRGRIALRDENEAHSANIKWLQCGDKYDIRVTSLFGQGAHLFGSDTLASLKTSDSQIAHARNAQQLLRRQLGWTFPVSELLFWLRGVPAPMMDYQIENQETSFQQSDWQLSYPRLKQVDNYQLPSKIIANNNPLKITLIVKDWQLQPDCSKL